MRIDDEVGVRLELEWVSRGRSVDSRRFSRRIAQHLSDLGGRGQENSALEGLPAGWHCSEFLLPESRILYVGHYKEPGDAGFAVSMHFHFDDEADSSACRAVVARVIRSFRRHSAGPIPWSYYDVAYVLDKRFALTGAALQAGRKMLTFQWRLRRLLVWHVSLADLLLREQTAVEWAVSFLNETALVRGPTFETTADGTVRARRARRHPFGHFEELARGCLRYAVGVQHVADRNMIALWVLQHRRESDLALMPQSLRAEDAVHLLTEEGA